MREEAIHNEEGNHAERGGDRFIKWFLLSFVMLSASVFFWKRSDLFPWIGSCNPGGYSDDNFMAYCHSTRYGDYEHKAFWEQLLPGLIENAKQADVLMLGNSRTQYAFSTDAVSDFFAKRPAKHYVFGFGMGSQNLVPEKLAEKYEIKAKALIINADPFFSDWLSNTNRQMLKQDNSSKWEYQLKIWLQQTQRKLCQNRNDGWIHSLWCAGKDETLYRRPLDGHWEVEYFRPNKRIPVAVDPNPRLQVNLDEAAPIAERFFKNMGVEKSCVFLTVTPRTDTPLNFAQDLAAKLGVHGVFPDYEGLLTVDDSHLDPPSAQRWSEALFREIEDDLDKCLVATSTP